MSRSEDEGAKRTPARPSLHDEDLDEFGPTLGLEPAKPTGGLKIAVNRPVPMAELMTPEAEQRKKIAAQTTFVAMKPQGLPPPPVAVKPSDAEDTKDENEERQEPPLRPTPPPRAATASPTPRKPGKAPPRVPSRKR